MHPLNYEYRNPKKPETMKSKILSLFALLALAFTSAQAGVEDAKTLCVEMKSGEVITFPLIDRPRMTFKGTYVIVAASESKIMKFKDVKMAYFTEEETAVNSAELTPESMATLGNTIAFSNYAPGTKVRVYTPNGNLMKQAVTDAEGRLTLTIADLPVGIYFVKGGNTVFKFKKK